VPFGWSYRTERRRGRALGRVGCCVRSYEQDSRLRSV
jgi:hypothetical protein